MVDSVPLVEAMKLVRASTWPRDWQSSHIDMLIQAVLGGLYPGPEWLITLEPGSRIIHVSRWRLVSAGETDMWALIPDSRRDLDCEELETSGEGWLALAQSQMP